MPLPINDSWGYHERTLPIAYPCLLLEILDERRIARAHALDGTGVQSAWLEQPEARITPMQWMLLAANAVRLTGDAGLGCEFGLRLRPSAHGFLGFAAMSAPTLRLAVTFACRYFHVRLRQFQLVFTEQGDDAALELRELFPIPMLREFLYECQLIGIGRLCTELTGEASPQLEICCDWPEPDYYHRYRARLPSMRFSQFANQIRFPRAYLDRRLLLADDIGYRQALDQVEREHATFRFDAGDIIARLRAELVTDDGGYPELVIVAERMGIPPRTLKRKLQAAGSGFQMLLDEARYRDARRMLCSSDLDVQTISTRLGFENPSNFTKAFRRWAGQTPSEFRREDASAQSEGRSTDT